MQSRIRMKCLLCLWAFLLMVATTSTLAASTINHIRISHSESGARVVFDMTEASDHKLFQLQDPERLVIDIEGASLVVDPATLQLTHTPIRQIRSAKKENGAIRVVFDLTKPVKAKSFVLPENDQKVHRLVVDLSVEEKTKAQEQPTASMSNRIKIKRDLVIAIDAGHGGQDPGAVGVNQMHEKDVVYAISKKIETLFNQQKGYKAEMVRKGDYFIPLAKRRLIAKSNNADMFISVHADSYTHKKARGASVYILSSKGASSASAKFLAERENKADLVGGVNLSDKDDVLSSVLVDLSMTYKMESSYDVAEQVLKHLGHVTRLHGNHVEKAAFSVLKTLDIPSILVETGFMSNPAEAKNLSSNAFQQKIAAAIFHGVDDYFKEKAPDDTYIAASFRHNRALTHVVERGDTLSQIALRYNVPLSSLMDANRLETHTLNVGQTLHIPMTN